LHGPLRLLLDDDGAFCHKATMADIADTQAHQTARSQLAVDGEVEKSELPSSVPNLKAHSNSPDVFQLQWGLLPYELALVPRDSSRGVNELFHDRLPFSE
jgi:hypothetical protein